MDRLSQINSNERASIQDPNIIELPPQNHDIHMIESDSETVIINSNENIEIIEAESIPEETPAAADGADKKRKHWKEDEHRQFLKGLKKYKRGQWKEISKEFVTTRTPSQIASHAQKYFGRQDTKQKERKKRRSIHDTTIDKNGRLVTLPIKKHYEIPIPSIAQQNNNTCSLVINPIDEQNEIRSHGTILNDSNNDNLVTTSIEPLQGTPQEHRQFMCTFRTRDILPQDMKNVIKMWELLQRTLKDD